jgi:hypothetical protein
MLVLSQQRPNVLFGDSAPEVEGAIYLNNGYIFSSKNLLNNILLLYNAVGNHFTLHIDGTLKITSDGWVLVIVGSHSVNLGNLITHTSRHITFYREDNVWYSRSAY